MRYRPKGAEASGREAEIKRRQKLIVGMVFTEEERDLFLDPDRDMPKRREFRAPFGQYKGQPLRNINIGYLEWMVNNCKLTPWWKDVISNHIRFRRSLARKEAEGKR